MEGLFDIKASRWFHKPTQPLHVPWPTYDKKGKHKTTLRASDIPGWNNVVLWLKSQSQPDYNTSCTLQTSIETTITFQGACIYDVKGKTLALLTVFRWFSIQSIKLNYKVVQLQTPDQDLDLVELIEQSSEPQRYGCFESFQRQFSFFTADVLTYHSSKKHRCY